jgi:hypothetical protein
LIFLITGKASPCLIFTISQPSRDDLNACSHLYSVSANATTPGHWGIFPEKLPSSSLSYTALAIAS